MPELKGLNTTGKQGGPVLDGSGKLPLTVAIVPLTCVIVPLI